MTGPQPAIVGPGEAVDWVLVGTVLAPVGVQGEVKVEVRSDVAHRYAPGAILYLDGFPLQVQRRRGPGSRVVKFRGVESRAAAEALRGKHLYTPEAEAPSLPQDTYYYYQLLGMQVVTAQGEDLGTVEEILATGANDVYVVRGPGGETLLPALAHVVVAVDLKGQRMTVNLPPVL